MCVSETLAIEVSSTSMKVAMLMMPTISHGLRLPAADRASVQPLLLLAVSATQRTVTRGTTDMPGPIGNLRHSAPSNSIRTGTRCTTLT